MTTAMALKLLSSTFPSSYAKIIVFRFGVADAVLAVSPAEFKANLLELVHLAKASGKTVLLVEPSSVPAIANTLVAPMRSVVAEVAKSEQVPLVILHDLPWATPDGLHPDQATADLYAGRIVTSLLGML